MKKFLVSVFAMLAVIVASAENYTVTVSTQKQIIYKDASGDVVATETAPGNVMAFEVVADTPRQAENDALHQCQGACDSGVEVLVATGVSKKGKTCDKYVKTVPWKAEAKLSR